MIDPAADIISEALLVPLTGDTSNEERFRCDSFRADVDGTGRGERVAAAMTQGFPQAPGTTHSEARQGREAALSTLKQTVSAPIV